MANVRTLVLASRSPRRRQLLQEAGLTFLTCSADTPESLDLSLGLDLAIMAIAKEKALAVKDQVAKIENPLVLSSDTLVILNDKILGKPRDSAQAVEFLEKLSGQTHQVKTAIYFWDVVREVHVSDLETSHVTFRKLSSQEIADYVASGEPMDKAGAYGIQGEGGRFISKLEGNLDNVMGLPVARVLSHLAQNQWTLV